MGWVVSNFLIAGCTPHPLGNNFTAAPPGALETGSRLLNIAANKQEQFVSLAQAIEREDRVEDLRFAERQDRKRNREALSAELEVAIRSHPAKEWEALFNRIGIPAGRVLSVPDALAHPQVKQGELLQTFDAVPGVNRPVTLTRAGFKLSGANPFVSSPRPQFGQHTLEVLRDLGFAEDEITHFKAAGEI
jgi:CoA:oxalate CoA-transferase